MSDAPHLQTGRSAEDYARRWLEARGLKHICSNFRCRFGELDLVMQERGCLVIVEVRYRYSDEYGGALPSVTHTKLQRIAKAMQALLLQHRELRELPLRFDVLALSGPLNAPKVRWCKRACSFDEVG
jgi:putative endonuclease